MINPVPDATGSAGAAVLRPILIDNYSSVRFAHASSVRAFLGGQLSAEELEALVNHIYDPRYVEELQCEDLFGAWLDGELVGTGGWMPADDHGRVARVTSLYVRPLFNRLGLGTRLLKDAEERARRAGFSEYSMRAVPASLPFLERQGYVVTSFGTQPFGSRDVNVVYLRKRLPAVAERAHNNNERIAEAPALVSRLAIAD